MRLIGKTTSVYGLKGTGKSNLVQYLARLPQFGGHLVYDVTREHSGRLNTYIPTNREGEAAREELNQVIRRMVTNQEREMRPDLVVIEEMSRFCSPNQRPPSAVYELLDLARHYRVGLVTVARRPAQVHSDLTELADNVMYFRLVGKNDNRALDQTLTGLSEVVKNLPDYHFARLTPDRRVMVHPPVPEQETTGRL